MPDRSWNRQLAAGDTQPIPHSLATVVARFLANNAAGRRASGPDDSICFISPNERRVAGPTVFCVAAILRTEYRFSGHKRDILRSPDHVRLWGQSGHLLALAQER